jgi:hypothetical protein
MGFYRYLLIDVEVEDVGNLEIGPIYKNEVAADHNVHVVGRRRWQHGFQFARAGLHLFLEARRKCAVHNQLALQSGRKTVALSQTRRQVVVVRTIPVVDLTVMIFIVAVAIPMSVTISMSMAVIVVIAAIVGAIFVVAVVFVMPVAVSLRHGDGRGKRNCDQCAHASAEPNLERH